MTDSGPGERDIPSMVVELRERAEEEGASIPELFSGDDTSMTVKERPQHLSNRIGRQTAPDSINPKTHVWLEWDEFKDSDPTFPHFHAIGESGCGRENVAPCVLTTKGRATEAWFLAEPCPFCFGEGTITHIEENDGEIEMWTDD